MEWSIKEQPMHGLVREMFWQGGFISMGLDTIVCNILQVTQK